MDHQKELHSKDKAEGVKKSEITKVLEILKEYIKTTRKTNLNRESKKYTPYEMLISCLLSLRSKDETTERVSKQLFAVANTPKQILALSDKRLQKLIFSSGHYKKKAATLKHVSKEILERFEGRVPDTEEELLSIKGIGRKTANIVLCLSYNKQCIPIDTHCHRIPNRIGWIKTKNPDETEQELMKIVPKKYWMNFNEIFVLFGRTMCLPISPLCNQCPIRKYCKRVNVINSR